MNSIDTESTTNTSAGGASAPVRKQGGSKVGVYAVTAVLIIALAGVAAYFGGFIGGSSENSPEASEVTAGAGAVVAVVNSKEISRSELDEMLKGVRASVAPETLLSVSEEELEKNVLEDLINMHLLLEASKAKGIVVTPDEIQAEFAKFEDSAGGKEALMTELGKVSLTEEKFRTNIENELRVQRLLEQETNMNSISVTDEEILAIYEQARAMAPEGEEFPELAEVSDAARMQLMQQKSGEAINAYIETLRAGASIELKL